MRLSKMRQTHQTQPKSIDKAIYFRYSIIDVDFPLTSTKRYAHKFQRLVYKKRNYHNYFCCPNPSTNRFRDRTIE